MYERWAINSPASKIKKYLIFDNEDPETVYFANLFFKFKQLQMGQIEEKIERESILNNWRETKTIKKEMGVGENEILLYEFKNKQYKVRCVPLSNLFVSGKLLNMDTNYFLFKISKDRSKIEIEKEISEEVRKDEFNIHDLVGGEIELQNNAREALMNLGLSHLIGEDKKTPKI